MFRKLALYCLVASLVFLLVACGGGGGGGQKSIALNFTAYTSLGEGAFPSGALNCGWGGKAFGQYNTGSNNSPIWHAFAWNRSTGDKEDWNPASYASSFISGTDGAQQVGRGARSDDLGHLRGLIWSNSASDTIDILPTGFSQVVFNAVDNNFQVGLATPVATNHPFVFNGTNDSGIDLMPSSGGYARGEAICISGNAIGGIMWLGSGLAHGCFWTTHDAASFIDLHSGTYKQTTVSGVSTNEQVGWGQTFQDDGFGGLTGHALLWKGSAGSVIDLNPSDEESSIALGVRNGVQVGFYFENGHQDKQRACLWQGSPNKMLDLDQYITEPHDGSAAMWMDSEGRIYGLVYPHEGNVFSVVWTPTS